MRADNKSQERTEVFPQVSQFTLFKDSDEMTNSYYKLFSAVFFTYPINSETITVLSVSVPASETLLHLIFHDLKRFTE